VALAPAPDRAIWNHARNHGFVIVSKDEDFHRLSVLHGPPPKVIWIRLGNCSTDDVLRLLRARREEIDAFVSHTEAAFLALA
jgi:predicted nuclease of predicted toxin-antitoxin system